MPAPRQPNTGPATAAAIAARDRRAAEDPEKLARAARVVRAALTHGRLTLADLVPEQRGATA